MGYSFDTRWEKQLDSWLTNPPEGEESQLHCQGCGQEIYPGELIYDLDDNYYCSDCAKEWLAQFETEATEEMCYGSD